MGGRAAWILAAILLAGLVLRCWGLSFGLPNIHCRPDESTLVHRALAIGAGDPNPHFFNYPSLHFYLLAALYGAYYIAGFASGIFANTAEFEAQFLIDPSAFYLIGRGLGALFGVASIWVLYGIGCRLGGRSLGLVSALFLSCSFLHVRDSHFLTVDIPATFYLLVSLLFSLCYVDGRKARDLVLGAIFLGLSASTKYNLGLFAGAVLIAGCMGTENWRERGRRSCWVLGIMGAAFIAGSPYVLLDFAAFWRDLSYERLHFARGHEADFGRGWWYHLGFTLPLGLGWPLFVAALLGVSRWVWRPRGGEWVLLVGIAGYYAVAGSGKLVFMRYMLPLLPLLCVAAAALIVAYGRSARGIALLALLVVVPTAWSSWHHSELLAKVDTRVLAARWIEERVPAGNRIGLCCGSDYGYPQLSLDRSNLEMRLAELRSAGFAARRQERLLAMGEAAPGPGYELIEMRAVNPSGFSWVWTTAEIERLLRERVTWVVVHEFPDLAYSQLDSSFIAGLERVADRLVLFDPLVDGQSQRLYDPIDAFYVPISGFASVKRPGPRIAIYHMNEL